MGHPRVALVCSSYAPYLGGVEEHVRQVARELASRGGDVVVWTVDRGEHLGIREVDGVEVRYLPTPLPARSLKDVTHFLRRLPSAAMAWRRAFRDFRPDVLHVQCFGPNGLYASVLARSTRTPLVISSHGETFADDHSVFDESALLRAGMGWAVRRATVVTGCSSLVTGDLSERFGVRDGVVVPNGVELDGFELPREPSETPLVFAVGRLERMKGFDLLVEAFAHSSFARAGRLVIGGEGSAASSLQSQAQRLGIAERVSLPGRLSPTEVAEHMAAAWVAAVPSRREAFGIVVLEAWRAGTPLLVTSRGGPSDLVTDGMDGVIVDPEDTDGFASALSWAMTDRGAAEAVGVAGRATVRRFTWSRVVDLYESFYDQAAGR